MSGIFWLDWVALAVSLHNTILLLWLGLSVLLNAEKPNWGIWLSGGALLLASAFFVSHTVILMLGFTPFSRGLDFWWRLGWIPVIVLPFAWYLVTLWYAGFWEKQPNDLFLRQRPWFFLATFLTLGLVALLGFAYPLPAFVQAVNLDLSNTHQVGSVSLLLLYVLDVLLCVVFSLDALRRPGPSTRVMGDLARKRARPWLTAAAVVLLTVGLLVAGIIVWGLGMARLGFPPDAALTHALAWFDLGIATLLAVAIILIGQAIAHYEVFAGKVLPRRGLMRHWRNAVILAVGYGVVVGWSLTVRLEPIYSVLLTTVLMTVFYALLSWRTYTERDHYMRRLRPFVSSQGLYDHVLGSALAPSEVDAATPFRALCRDVLGARMAHLTAVGPLAPLVPSLVYPERAAMLPPSPSEIARFDSPQTMCITLDPSRNGGALWAVPLWSERGLIGVLRLGAKSDGGLYAQEEIEIARASGERLIDTCASAELARRLLVLQRQRWAESQLLDRQARRVLHDDVLPRLHAAILALSGGASSVEAIDLLMPAHRQTADLLRDMPTAAAPEVARLGLSGALQHTVEEEWRCDFDSVIWEIESEAERQTHALPGLTAETLFFAVREAIRNAARYGRDGDSARPLHLYLAVLWRDGLKILIEDDGVGLHKTESAAQGSGQGLALHSAMLAVVGGTLAVEPLAGGGTRVTLGIPREALRQFPSAEAPSV
jgi:signal transduction histidine kinase